MIEEAIFTRLSNFAGLTALIGAPPACRLFPRLNMQDVTYPSVTFMRVSAHRESAMGADPGLVHARFQLDAWDIDRDNCRDVTEQLRQALQRWRGLVAGVTVQDTFLEDQQEPAPELVDAVPVFRSITDVMVHYNE